MTIEFQQTTFDTLDLTLNLVLYLLSKTVLLYIDKNQSILGFHPNWPKEY